MSDFFVAVMKVLGIKTVRTTAYHPQTNGQFEQYNRACAAQLRHCVTDDPTRWDTCSLSSPWHITANITGQQDSLRSRW